MYPSIRLYYLERQGMWELGLEREGGGGEWLSIPVRILFDKSIFGFTSSCPTHLSYLRTVLTNTEVFLSGL